MRMLDPGPFGDTFLEASVLAMIAGFFGKQPFRRMGRVRLHPRHPPVLSSGRYKHLLFFIG